jgi:hypothetical protein
VTAAVLNLDFQSCVIVHGLKMELVGACYRLGEVVLWVEALVTNHLAAAVLLEVSAMFLVFVAVFCYIVVLLSAVVVGEVVKDAG